MEGVVTIVQEGRFLLQTDNGAAHLIILSHRAAAEPDQLPALQHNQSRVRIVCEPAPGLIGFIARRVEVLPVVARVQST